MQFGGWVSRFDPVRAGYVVKRAGSNNIPINWIQLYNINAMTAIRKSQWGGPTKSHPLQSPLPSHSGMSVRIIHLSLVEYLYLLMTGVAWWSVYAAYRALKQGEVTIPGDRSRAPTPRSDACLMRLFLKYTLTKEVFLALNRSKKISITKYRFRSSYLGFSLPN